MLTTKRPTGVALEMLKPRADVTRKFKTGVSVAPQKGIMSSENLRGSQLNLCGIVLK